MERLLVAAQLCAWSLLPVAAWIWWRFRLRPERHPWRWTVLFVAVWSVEYWLPGPYSYTGVLDEGELYFPVMTWLRGFATRDTFVPAIGGGEDIHYLASFGDAALLSLQSLLSQALPLWTVLAFFKIAAAALGFCGPYLIARRHFGLGLPSALAIAALWAGSALKVSTPLITLLLAILPLIGFVVVMRQDRPAYWLPVLGVAAIVAMIDPAHALLSLGCTIVVVAAWCGRLSPRAVAATAFMAGLSMVNWAELIHYGIVMMSMSPRGLMFGTQPLLSPERFTPLLPLVFDPQPMSAVFALSVLVLIRNDRAALVPVARALAADVVTRALYFAVPWQTIGLGMISGLMPQQMTSELVAVLAAMAALRSLAATNMGPLTEARALTALFAVTVASLTYVKIGHGINYLWFGGQNAVGNAVNLSSAPWAPADRWSFRVATLQGPSLRSDYPLAYGFHTFTTRNNFSTVETLRFFKSGLAGPAGLPAAHRDDRHLQLHWVRRPDGSAPSLSEVIDRDLALMANIRFLISEFALSDAQPVSAPPEDAAAPLERPSSARDLPAFLRYTRDKIFGRRWVYVYDLGEPRSKCYWASTIEHAADASVESMLAAMRRSAVSGGAVLAPNASPINSLDSRPNPIAAACRLDGDVVEVADVPANGGLLIFNVPRTPFWRAEDESGRILPVLSANMVQMAVPAPAGTSRVRLIYHRPTIWALLRKTLSL